MKQVWDVARARLKTTINNVQYCTWIEPLAFSYVDEESDEIHLVWPESEGTLKYVDKRFHRLIEETINTIISTPEHYSIVIERGGGTFCVDEVCGGKKLVEQDIVFDMIVENCLPEVESGDNGSDEYFDLIATLISDELSIMEGDGITTVSVRFDDNDSDSITKLKLDKRTFIQGRFSYGEKIRVITEKNSKGGLTNCFPAIIAGSSFKDFFDGSLENLRLFQSANRETQELIVNQQSIASDNKKHAGTYCCIDTFEKAKAFYALTRSSFSHNQRAAIESWIDNYETDKDAGKKLKMFLNISPVYNSKNAVVSTQELYERLDKAVMGLESSKKEIVKAFAVSKRTQSAGILICLVGPSGTGKTSFAMALSDALDKPLQFIPCSELTFANDVAGDRGVYIGASAGKLFSSFSKAGTTDCVLVFDELDKLPSTNTRSLSKDGNPYDALLEFFSNRIARDRFLGTELYCPKTIIVCTCNTLDTIPSTIRNRFDSIIRIHAYSNDQIVRIVKKHTIPKMERIYNIPKGQIKFSEEALREILRYIDDFGMRRTEHHLESIYREILSDWDDRERNVVITQEMVRNILKDSVDMDDIRVIFRSNISLYPEKQRNKIIYLEEQLDRQDLADDKRQLIQKQLEYMTMLRPDKTSFSFDAERFFGETEKQIHGRTQEKRRHAAIFNDMAVKRTDDSRAVIFIGPPGAGKTVLIKAAASAADMKYIRIPLNGMSDPEVLFGQKPTANNADAGLFVRETAKAGSLRVMIHLEDLDYSGYHVQASLLSLIEGSLEDNYLEGFPVDISSSVVFVATANDSNRIIPALLSRFAVVNVSPYSFEEQKEILKSHIIPEAISGYPKEIVFLPDAEDLLMEYACKGGVRELKGSVRAVVSNAYLLKSEMEKVVIYKQDVLDTLGPAKTERVLGFV